MQQKRGRRGKVSAMGSFGLSQPGAYKKSNAARIDIEARIGRAVGDSESASVEEHISDSARSQRRLTAGFLQLYLLESTLVHEVQGLERPQRAGMFAMQWSQTSTGWPPRRSPCVIRRHRWLCWRPRKTAVPA